MLKEETISTILSLYKKYQNDISLFSSEDYQLLINYLVEHTQFSEIQKNKGLSILKKVLYNMKIIEIKKEEEIMKFDETNKKCYIYLFGEIKKKNFFKGSKRLGKKKYINCNYKCLSVCFFAELDNDFYIKYILEEPSILLKDFIQKLFKFQFFKNLSIIEYKTLFLNYEERIYNQNEIIYKEGDEIDGIYLIIEGECKIIKENLSKELLLSKEMIRIINNKNSLHHKSFFSRNEIISNDFKCQTERKKFTSILSNNINKNKVLLIIRECDLFGDLEISKNIKKRQFSIISSNFMKSRLWFFPTKISNIFLRNIQKLSSQKYQILKTRIEFANFMEKMKNIDEANSKKTFEVAKIHNLNEKRFKINILSLTKIKNIINNNIIMREEKKGNDIFLTSFRNISNNKKNNSNNITSKEMNLKWNPNNFYFNKNNNKILNISKCLKDKILKNSEINLFRKKRISLDKFKKKINKYESRNRNINPINICFLSDRITNYCHFKEDDNNKKECKTKKKYSYSNKSNGNSSNSETRTSNNKRVSSFYSFENSL